jgi:hypothetical protein
MPSGISVGHLFLEVDAGVQTEPEVVDRVILGVDK